MDSSLKGDMRLYPTFILKNNEYNMKNEGSTNVLRKNRSNYRVVLESNSLKRAFRRGNRKYHQEKTDTCLKHIATCR